MGWKCTINGATLTEDELTNGEYETLFITVNRGLPHSEADVHPAHCPTCRNAILITALQRAEVPYQAAVQLVAGLSPEEAVNAFIPEDAALPDVAVAVEGTDGSRREVDWKLDTTFEPDSHVEAPTPTVV